jgi:hypothetical protein
MMQVSMATVLMSQLLTADPYQRLAHFGGVEKEAIKAVLAQPFFRGSTARLHGSHSARTPLHHYALLTDGPRPFMWRTLSPSSPLPLHQYTPLTDAAVSCVLQARLLLSINDDQPVSFPTLPSYTQQCKRLFTDPDRLNGRQKPLTGPFHVFLSRAPPPPPIDSLSIRELLSLLSRTHYIHIYMLLGMPALRSPPQPTTHRAALSCALVVAAALIDAVFESRHAR